MTMNSDIKYFPILSLTTQGTLIPIRGIESTADYNHSAYHLHHYIPKQSYNKNREWYEERGLYKKR